MSSRVDFEQWTADNDRLVIAGLSNGDGTPLSYDEETIETVKKRALARFGPRRGLAYFQGLIATLPDRRPDLFPELQDLPK
jgi:hypothetical protein